jgi:hypothetical protein
LSAPPSRRACPRLVVVALLASFAPGCALRLGYDEVPSDDAPGDDAADAGLGAAPDGAAAAAALCGSFGLLRDGFDDAAIGPQWIALAPQGVTVSETGGHLAIALGVGSDGVEAGYASRNAYDVRQSAIAVTVLRTAGERAGLELRDPERRGAALAVIGGRLAAVVLDRDLEAERATVVYDPTAHRHWRLREDGGVLHWETSADRSGWSTLHAEALPMTGALAHGRLVARGQTLDGGETWFDDVNLPAAAMPGPCPASSVSDSFDDGVVATSYNNWVDGTSCTGREVGGMFELSFSGAGDAWCGLETRQTLDLRDTAVVVEAPTTPDFRTAMAFFEAVTPAGDQIQIGRGPDGLFGEMQRGVQQVFWDAVPYDAAAHRFWRLREAGGQTYWDTSADGVTWSNHFAAPTGIDVSAVIIDIAAGHWTPGPGTPFVVRYDHLGLAP